MNCRDFRQQHGDWVDDMVVPTEADRLARHLVECAACARFDTLARRALMVARNAPPIEVSSDFSARLAARIADERRARIAEHAPSHAERPPVFAAASRAVWVRRAATVALMAGGTLAARSVLSGSASPAVYLGDDAPTRVGMPANGSLPMASFSTLQSVRPGQIVVVSPVRQVGGALLPMSEDRLLDGADLAMHGDVSATTVAATAPLWPTAHMAAHAAHRFAAMEFGDVMPVHAVGASR